MLNTDQVEQAEQESKPDKVNKAFIRSDGHKLPLMTKDGIRDMLLKPYSDSRDVAAQTMGLIYGYVDEGGKARFDRTKMYLGVKNDVAIVMWLCLEATEEEINAACAEGPPYRAKAIVWAGKKGLLDEEDELFWKAYKLMIEIINEVKESRSKAQKKTYPSGSETQTPTTATTSIPRGTPTT